MKTENIYPIRIVARQTGLNQHRIRVWERRYRVVVPKRTDTNRRLYSEADISRLQLLRRAVALGHTISQVAGMSSEKLMRLINQNSNRNRQVEPDGERISDAAYFCELSLASVVKMDMDGLESALSRAAVNLTRLELIVNLIVPLCQKMGEMWKNGDMKIVNEHLATPVIRAFLWDVLRSTHVAALAPKIVIATPLGQPHELGALTIALIAGESGWDPFYFGPSLPAEEIAAAAKFVEARAVALSITHHSDNLRLNKELNRVCDYLGGNIQLFIGGQNAVCFADSCASGGIQLVKNIEQFRNVLESQFN